MKKIVLFILFIFSIFILFGSKVKANNFNDYSNSSILMDMDSGRVLYGKNIHNKNLTASIAKIMTCIVAIENGNLNDVCVVDEETVNQIGSSTYLKFGDKIRLNDLLYGMMLRSGNDAAFLIGKTVGGNIKEFVRMMNLTAIKIGMKNSKFENVSGLDEDSQNISTAFDMALLMSYCMKNNEFRKIVCCRSHSFTSLLNNNYTFLNKHKLVNGNDNVTGGKTGYTINAKRTLVTSFSKNNMNLVVVTFKCSNDWELHESLFNYAINNYKHVKLIDKGIIDIGKLNYTYTPIIYEDVSIILKNDEKAKCQLFLKENKNDLIIGIIKVIINEKIVKEVFIYRYY